MASSFNFCVWILGASGDPFTVDIAASATGQRLAIKIKEEMKPTLDHLAYNQLVLWKVNHLEHICRYCVVTRLQLQHPIPSADVASKLSGIDNGTEISGAERLNPVQKLSNYFTGFAEPVQESVVLVVQVSSSPGSGY